jgi:hypothetical protein
MTRPDLVERARRGEREAFAELAALEIDRLHATATLNDVGACPLMGEVAWLELG